MKIELNLKKGYLLVTIFLITLIIMLAVAFAFNPSWQSNPIPESTRNTKAAQMGHSFDEIAGLKEYIDSRISSGISTTTSCGDGLKQSTESCDDGANSWRDGDCAGDCSSSNTLTFSSSENGGVWSTNTNGDQLCKEEFPGKNWIMVYYTEGSTWDWYYAGYLTSTHSWNTNCQSPACPGGSTGRYFTKVWCGPAGTIYAGNAKSVTR